MKNLLFPSLLALALAACQTDTQGTSAKIDDESMQQPQQTRVTAVDATKRGDASDLPDWARDSSRNSVFFDYDSYVIRSDARPVIEAHANLLARQPDRKVTIQGNADERGSREYNLALGQKRAEAVRRAMKLQGANDMQIEAVSLGKEHPRCAASTESCYAQNRRGDFVYFR
ncbi:MAG: peptidoglycan-associated lipoprotein Pal [Azoarcus sp.]|jgi:peptidoglycan-associated lipoprotein|nr:peptidoglycan-associated lipoprotein Pal [Azoarcus sp.]